jgi:general secretion pathway protein D
VFFNRFGKQTSLHTPSSLSASTQKTTPNKKSSDSGEGILHPRAVALALAVQFALPAGMLSRNQSVRAAGPADMPDAKASTKSSNDPFEKLFGTPRTAMPQLSSSAGEVAAEFKAGINQIIAGEFEKAVTTLQNLPVDHLNDSDSSIVDDTLAHARVAARSQRSARADLMIGQDLLAKQQVMEAAPRLRRAMDNAFADAATKEQAGKEMAAIKASLTTAANFQPIHADTPATTAPADAGTPAAAMPPATPPATTDATAVTPPATPATPATPTTDTTPTFTPVNATPPAAAATPVTPATPAPTPTATTDTTPTFTPVNSTPGAATPGAVNPGAVAPVAGAGAVGEEAAANEAIDTAAKLKAIQQQKDAYDAQKLVEKARGEEAAGQNTDALRDFGAAVKLDSTNEQAKAGYGEMADKLGLVSQKTEGDQQYNEIAIKVKAINSHFDSAIQTANEHIAAGKFNDARDDIEKAQRWANDDPTLFTQPQINDFNTRLEQARVRLEAARSEQASTDEDKAREDARKAQEEKDKRFREDREKTIAGLIQDARQYSDESKYTEALAVIDNIQRLDPNNKYAGDVKAYIEDKAAAQNQRKYTEDRDRETTKVFNDAKERIVPYEDIIRYAPDWPSISEERDNEVKADRGEDAEDAALQAQLDHHLPEVRFNANALSDVIDFLQSVTGANIFVDWPALERASIARDAPVTARLRDIKFSKALELIFKSVEGDDEDHKLGYTIDEGVITISTKKELSKNTVTRKYDINDLLFVAPDYNNAPSLSLQNAGQGQSGGGGGGGGGGQSGQSLFDNASSNQNSTQQNQDRQTRIDEISKFITENVDPDSWTAGAGAGAGAGNASISSSPLRAVLLITQTPENHRKIQSVLDSLRASQALQVSVETRFLIVQRNYLEDIGVNVDVEFNPLQNPANARSGVNSSRFTPLSITQTAVTDNTTFRDANGNVVANQAQGSRTLDWISNVGNAAVPGSIPANPADYPNPLVVSGSYVDNLTVNFLIRAVQANQNTTSLTAPRLTLFSGQRAVIIVQTQQAYVSNLTPVVAPGAALFDPTVSTTTATGVVLSVQATVSPDRKYVFLDLQPQLARLRALVPFTISAVVTPVNNVVTTSAPQIVSGTLQLPTIDLTVVRTSCSVPDGATLLLGGQTLAAETTREQGVPVLSKIPFLKRLFTNRATAQDEQVLLILVKPTILIQREQELKQFPQLSSKLN